MVFKPAVGGSEAEYNYLFPPGEVVAVVLVFPGVVFFPLGLDGRFDGWLGFIIGMRKLPRMFMSQTVWKSDENWWRRWHFSSWIFQVISRMKSHFQMQAWVFVRHSFKSRWCYYPYSVPTAWKLGTNRKWHFPKYTRDKLNFIQMSPTHVCYLYMIPATSVDQFVACSNFLFFFCIHSDLI